MPRPLCLRRRFRAVFASAALAGAFWLASGSAQAQQSVEVAINDVFVAHYQGNGDNPAGCCPLTQSGGATSFICPTPGSGLNLGCGAGGGTGPARGYISNDPRINFSNSGEVGACNVANLSTGDTAQDVCNSQVLICAQIAGTAAPGTAIAIDELEFEIFKFQNGSNPLDPTSTPPLRTYFLDGIGSINVACGNGVTSCTNFAPNTNEEACILWDGSYNIQGLFGRSNGQFGVRITVQSNQQSNGNNVTISQTRAYPSATTVDGNNNTVPQQPITVDVTDVHAIVSSPTIVGVITGVAAEPYNLSYRLSRDANMFITINRSVAPFPQVRSVVNGLPRPGEGVPAGTLTDGDSWNGRDNNGNIVAPGTYLAVFQANSANQYGNDLSPATTYQISLDPLQYTDIAVAPLTDGATALAVLSYQLTEPATTFVDIYPPGTQFCPNGDQGLNDVNNATHDPGTADNPNIAGALTPAKGFFAHAGSCAGAVVSPLREIVQQQVARKPVLSFWDGRDNNGNAMTDGDYVFVIYGSLPSPAGTAYNGNAADLRIWSSIAKTGFISVLRGLVGITQITPTSTVVGSSPVVAGLNPFSFSYQLSRPAIVSVKIFDSSGANLIKTLVSLETRTGGIPQTEIWSDGTNNAGLTVSSGTYLVQLTAQDPQFPAKVSTTTALFPVDLFRITDVGSTVLLAAATDQVTLNYQLSQPMFTAWNIYPPGTVVSNNPANWPPCPAQSPPNACTSPTITTAGGAPVAPIITFNGLRPGRFKITEFWDGRDPNGIFVPDGAYVFTLVAQSTTTPRYFASDRIYGTLTVARGAIIFTSFNVVPTIPQLFNSSNTITLDPFSINYTLTRQSSVTVQILTSAIPPTIVRTLVSGQVRDATVLQSDVWDGRDDRNNIPPSGFYTVRVLASDVASTLSSGSTAQTTISYEPLRIYDLAVSPIRPDSAGALIAYQVSEPMRVAIQIFKPNTLFNADGTPNPPESQSLVQRIVGQRPARVEIRDVWDGRDLQRELLPDGDYKFKIVGSTDPAAIDPITGDILNPNELALDVLLDDIPIALNGSANPQGDFETNSFVFPNPVSGPSATFRIYSPFQADVTLRLYTMSGTLMFSQDFGQVPPAYQSGPISFVWNKVNQNGRAVGRGLYYALIRVNATDGSGNVLQTVKKVLVQ